MTILAGSDRQAFEVPTIQDRIVEGGEILAVFLTDHPNHMVSCLPALVRIADDDTAPMVRSWGDGSLGVPADLGPVRSLHACAGHVLAVTASGQVRAWGSNDHGESDVPADLAPVTAVVAGRFCSLALLEDGTVRGWGDLTPPTDLGQVVAVAMAGQGGAALLTDGTIRTWGSDAAKRLASSLQQAAVLDLHGNGVMSPLFFLGPEGRLWSDDARFQAKNAQVTVVAVGDRCIMWAGHGFIMNWTWIDRWNFMNPPILDVIAMARGETCGLIQRADGSLSGSDIPADLADLRVLNIAASSQAMFVLVAPTLPRRVGFRLLRHDGSGLGTVRITSDLGPSRTTRTDGFADEDAVDDPGEQDDPLPFPSRDHIRQSFRFLPLVPDGNN